MKGNEIYRKSSIVKRPSPNHARVLVCMHPGTHSLLQVVFFGKDLYQFMGNTFL